MAEFPSLGKHCCAPLCKQLDFLPFTCDGCEKIYCSDHRTKSSHKCTEEHTNTSRPEYTGPKGITCFLDGCQNRELTPICCEHCKNSFCLRHRHAQDHGCMKVTRQESSGSTSKTAEHVKEILASKEPKPKKSRGAKSSKTAAKVALMKMKMHAVGDKATPEEEKIYLLILLPKSATTKSKPMFFSKTWSVGRVIDSIATRLSLKNENNVSYSKKLRLFTADDGEILPTDQSLDHYVTSELLYSGSSVILEYVDNDCVVLDSTESYKPEGSR